MSLETNKSLWPEVLLKVARLCDVNLVCPDEIDIDWWDTTQYLHDGSEDYWTPLNSNSDAFSIANKLGMTIKFSSDEIITSCNGVCVTLPPGNDAIKTARESIVLCGAALATLKGY